jgi:hypothetical protein
MGRRIPFVVRPVDGREEDNHGDYELTALTSEEKKIDRERETGP